MKFWFLPTCLITLICSCNNNPAPSQATPTTDSGSSTTTAPTRARECFEAANQQDTVRLSISKDGNIVTGSLSYRLQGKDKNDGLINGKMNGDTLIADYTFTSEGQQSVRQVAFVRQDKNMVEAFADVADQSGKMVFKPGAAFKLNTMVLQPLACDSVLSR